MSGAEYGRRLELDEERVFGGQSTADAITPDVGRYLVKVYSTLGATMVAAGAGTAASMLTPLGAVSPLVYGLGAFVPILGVSMTRGRDVSPTLRLGMLGAAGVMLGLSSGPLIGHYLAVDPALVGTAFMGTTAVFGGFSLVALKARRRKLLSLGGPLIGALLGMMVMQGSTWFIDYSPQTLKMLNNIYLYGGLAAFSAFISYDTQRMIENARDGHKDHIDDALQMFLNVRAVFMLLLQILGRRD